MNQVSHRAAFSQAKDISNKRKSLKSKYACIDTLPTDQRTN